MLLGGAALRALATGLPPAFLADPRRALARGALGGAGAQFVVFSTSADGDPLNASVPGTYDDARIVHSPDPALAPAPLMLGGRPTLAAAPWSTVPAAVLERTVFWHLMTGTPVHSKEPDVLRLMGAVAGREMLPSLLAAQLAPVLGTIQRQPVSVGASTPAESLSQAGAALPVVPPLALRATLANPRGGPLAALEPLRDATLDRLHGLYREVATPVQRRHIDALVTSRAQVRSLEQSLVDRLSRIRDNGPQAQVQAALALVAMQVSPVVTIHVPFGGDNHRDPGLATETAQTVSGVATLVSLMDELGAAGLADRVTLVTLNVFGRTLGPGNGDGRGHNPNHQVSLTIGRPFRGGVIGGVAPVDDDYGALPWDSTTGAPRGDGAVHAVDTLAAFARTVLAATGGDPAAVSSPDGTAQVIRGALA
jgi:hypothetical protein